MNIDKCPNCKRQLDHGCCDNCGICVGPPQ